MADITMCSGVACERAKDCYRHTAYANERWQSYFITPPVEADGACNYFWACYAEPVINLEVDA